MKKILIITKGFFPILSPRSLRATELAIEFSKQGHEVTVLTHRIEQVHANFEKDFGVKILNFVGKEWKEVINFENNSIKWHQRFIRRALLMFFDYPLIQYVFLVKHSIKKLNLFNSYDSLITIAVPHSIHWSISLLSKHTRRRISKVWIADCGDPYMYALHDTFRKFFYFHFFEWNFLRKADYITVPFDEMKLLFYMRFRHKFKVIPQGVQFKEWKLAQYVTNSCPTFAYSGLIMKGKRDPFELLDCLIEKNIDFKFIFYTTQNYLFDGYKSLLDSKIELRNYVPRETLFFELSKMDFLVNVDTASDAGVRNAIPSKLIDYHFTKRPILSYEHGKLSKELVDEFMSADYKRAFNDPDIERFDISKVAASFLALD